MIDSTIYLVDESTIMKIGLFLTTAFQLKYNFLYVEIKVNRFIL